MNRIRLALCAAGALIVAAQTPLLAQDEEETSAVEESDEAYEEYDYYDDETDDDSIDVDEDDDGHAETIEFVDDDWDVSFDDADEFGNEIGDGVDDNDPPLFQDELPEIRLSGERGEDDDTDDAGMAMDRPGLLSFGGIANGVLVRRRPTALLVKDGQASFQAQIRYRNDPLSWATAGEARAMGGRPKWEARHVCGGALIAAQWVLTAAHCVTERHFRRGVNVMLGGDSLASGGIEFEVDRVVLHGGYSDNNMYRNDIALLHLKYDPRLSAFRTIPLYTKPLPEPGTGISTLGWGKTERSNVSSELFRADMKLIGIRDCSQRPGYARKFVQAMNRWIEPVDSTVMCGGDTNTKACKGDSGGPVVLTNGAPVLLGIVSWTKKDSCGQPTEPGVYTRVGAFVMWIRTGMSLTPNPDGVNYLKI